MEPDDPAAEPLWPAPPDEPLAPPDEPLAPPDEPLAPPDEPLDEPLALPELPLDEPLAPPDEPLAPPDEPLAPPDEPLAPPDEPLDEPLALPELPLDEPLALPELPLALPEPPLAPFDPASPTGSVTSGPQAKTVDASRANEARARPSFIAAYYTTVPTRDRACKFARMRLPAFLGVHRTGLPMRRGVRASTWFYLGVAIMASAPAWIVRYPPLEDLPFHLATLRVVHSYSDPAYGFARDFFLNLGGTQYALYYVVGSALAYALGVVYAGVAMSCLYLGGTVLALRALLGSLRKDERLCLFVVPLLVNVMFLYGLMPFMSGIPLMFLGLAVSVRYIEEPTRGRGAALAVLALTLFYTHVVPYALFGIGFAALFPWTSPRKWLPVTAAVAPSLVAVLWWVALSPQGKESAGALGAAFIHPPYVEAMARLPRWSIDVFRDTTDEWHFIAWVVIGLLAVGLSQGDRDLAKPASRALVVVPIACTVLYFVTGSQLGDVWLLSERFPVPGLMSVVPLMRMPRGARGLLVTALALAVGVSSTVNVCRHFVRFQLDEVGDFDGAIDAMEPRKNVAALIYDKGSAIVNDVPFLHFGSYYQAQKGGVVQFSNSGALYWPVRFKPGHYPPPGVRPRLRWEWTPELVPIQELYPYYDYVLTRGNGFTPPPGTFHLVWRGRNWSVFGRMPLVEKPGSP